MGTSGSSSYECSFTSPYNDAWYYGLFDPTNGENYSGYSFVVVIEILELIPVTTTTTPSPTVTVTSTYNPCDVTPTPDEMEKLRCNVLSKRRRSWLCATSNFIKNIKWK
jgi:hypothetical protein